MEKVAQKPKVASAHHKDKVKMKEHSKSKEHKKK